MSNKKIVVDVLLPNGRSKQFRIEIGKQWRQTLTEQIRSLYPRASEIEIVEDLHLQRLKPNHSVESNVMFEVRKNYYVLGHIRANVESS